MERERATKKNFLTEAIHFDNNRSMEAEIVADPSALPVDLLTDDALQKLRALAEPGCLLCTTDSWDGEELE